MFVALRRSGGLAGIALARTVDVEDLSEDDTAQWRALLGDDELRALTDLMPGRTIPDAYSYHLACPPDADEVTVAEHDLPESVRDLFERTLQAWTVTVVEGGGPPRRSEPRRVETRESGAEGRGDVPGLK